MQLNLISLSLLVSTSLHFAAALPKISAVGSKFFTEDGDQFYVKGIAYQLTSADPLVNTDQTLSSSGVALSEYSASATSHSRPACPDSTLGVCNVDPNSPLPTIGQVHGPEPTVAGTAATPSETMEGAANRAGIFGGDHGFKLMSVALLSLAVFMGWSL